MREWILPVLGILAVAALTTAAIHEAVEARAAAIVQEAPCG